MYHLTVVQNERFIRIEIRQDDSNAELYIGATICKDPLSGRIGPAYVVIDEKISDPYSTEEAFGLADWIRMAAVAAGQLDYSITGKDDFDRKWTARMVGRTVVLEGRGRNV